MGRKKKKPVKPWCWYCNREFDDDKILVQHQRAKHFKCPFCHKKLYSGPGLTVHCIQVHKETLDKIPEALPNRNSVDIDIYGIQGIPEEDVREHERLKRGDEGPSKSSQDSGSNSARVNQVNRADQQPPAAIHNATAISAMHAAMYQHAMSMGSVPPGFPGISPGMPPPPGMPPGMPPMFPPSFMQPPPGFGPPGMPPMLPPPPHPGLAYQQPLMPPSSMAGVAPLGYPLPPPPSPPPPQAPPSPPTRDGPIASTSNSVPPPPPMSGVGHLIGIPPPNYNPSGKPPAPRGNIYESVIKHHKSSPSSQDDERSEANKESSSSQSSTVPNSTETITKPPQTIANTITATKLKSENVIEVPSLKARIMHPNGDLSLEEIRMSFGKYSTIIGGLKESPRQDSSLTT